MEAGFAERMADVRARLERASARAGRSVRAVTLVGASKTVPADRVAEAVTAGLADLGENRVQEAEAKIPAVHAALAAGAPVPVWHLIGHLQSNKARRAVALFDWIHSVDSVRLADALDRLAAELGRRPSVLIEVNTSGEASKAGVAPGETRGLAEHVARLPHLKLRGLMTIGPVVERAEDARPAFRALAGLLAETRRALGDSAEACDTLSMGMSGDFEVAVEEGATMVRVGSALFGARDAAA
ncbi:MAG: YggS family pyridoxal phosphate-dependent enzyme [Candidatus Eisenbacteria bacterium]